MERTLKTIKEHNDERLRIHGNKFLTGVACKCGAELQWEDNTVLLSYPAQRRAKCFECGTIETMLA